jgi:uncharacterized phage protein gp47/JayE
MVRDDITASLYGASFIGNTVLRVMADAMAGLAHHVLRYIDWLSLQLLPLTAETVWLDRHGNIWLVNADGTVGRKIASYAAGSATFTSPMFGIVVPAGTQLQSLEGVGYETTADALTSIDTPVEAPIRALDPGAQGNQDAGVVLSISAPLPNVDPGATVVSLLGGTDTETDDELRMRVLQRIRQPPMGGSAADYVRWALAVAGVTRAWCNPLEMGIGTVTVRFLMDDLRADNDGWPFDVDIQAVNSYIDSVRPVAVKDYWTLAPIKQFINVHILNLQPDTADTRAAIEDSLRAMLLEQAAPGQTIFAVWKSYAIMNAAGVVSFDLTHTIDDIMESPGNMAVLGDINYDPIVVS